MPTLLLQFSQSFATFFQSISVRLGSFARKHKIWSAVIALAALGIGWYAYGALTNTSGVPRYILGQVQSGTFIASVTGTGQVSASSAVTLTSQASGRLVAINVKDGQSVAQGQLIAVVDPTNALSAVASAKNDLSSAELALSKLQEPATQLSATQAQDAVTQASSTLQAAQNQLAKDYSTAATDIVSTFLDLPGIMSGMKDIDFGTELNNGGQWNIDWYENATVNYDTKVIAYRGDAYNAYTAALATYNQTFTDYKAVNLGAADPATIVSMLSEFSSATSQIQVMVKSANTLIQFYSDELTARNLTTPAYPTTSLSNLTSYTNKLQTHTTALLADANALAADKTAIATDGQNVTEKQLTLEQLQQGPDTLDIAADQVAIEQKKIALGSAQNALANYYVRAPFAGEAALGTIALGQQVGSSDTIATVVTQNQFADITLNEVDAAKIKVGDPATITLSALPNVTIAGSVADIAPIGVVSQGVVSYTVKIGFAAQQSQVKPGMSVSASIITRADSNVLIVPAGAVHAASDGSSYMLVFDPPLATSTAPGSAGSQSTTLGSATTQTPVEIPVTVAATNNTQTEISSGVLSGQQIIVRTVTNGAASPTIPSAGSTGGNARVGGGGGVFFRGG